MSEMKKLEMGGHQLQLNEELEKNFGRWRHI